MNASIFKIVFSQGLPSSNKGDLTEAGTTNDFPKIGKYVFAINVS